MYTMEEVEIGEDASSSVMKLELLPITASQLIEATWNDLTLSEVLLFSKQAKEQDFRERRKFSSFLAQEGDPFV